ncbi:hypothetical protein LCGC14_0506810 [marine sediment metagenome]|uniref:Uncharacterized protein n=1 Tax=marine sediment metagenome TaxID=412755 RepID=A0A0F9UP32_9ZZZZ
MRNLTEEEYEVIDLLGQAATKFRVLKPVHPSDTSEFQIYVHACQNIVLARPGTEEVIGMDFDDYPKRTGKYPRE